MEGHGDGGTGSYSARSWVLAAAPWLPEPPQASPGRMAHPPGRMARPPGPSVNQAHKWELEVCFLEVKLAAGDKATPRVRRALGLCCSGRVGSLMSPLGWGPSGCLGRRSLWPEGRWTQHCPNCGALLGLPQGDGAQKWLFFLHSSDTELQLWEWPSQYFAYLNKIFLWHIIPSWRSCLLHKVDGCFTAWKEEQIPDPRKGKALT